MSEQSTSTIELVVQGCPRCGANHTLAFQRLARPTAERFTHFAICPATSLLIHVKFARWTPDKPVSETEPTRS